MEFLNVLAIKKLAVAKGCTAAGAATIKYKHYVRLIRPDGSGIPGTCGVALGLAEAKRRLRHCRTGPFGERFTNPPVSRILAGRAAPK